MIKQQNKSVLWNSKGDLMTRKTTYLLALCSAVVLIGLLALASCGGGELRAIEDGAVLLARGARLDICTAAMLGRKDVVEEMLDENPDLINARGAHGISLMAHAAWSNNVALAEMLFQRGATQGTSMALGNAVLKGNVQMARWLIENGHPDFGWTNYEGKSLMALARETPNKDMINLLREHGAV